MTNGHSAHPSDEKIENEQYRAKKKENKSGVNAPPGEPSERAKKLRRNSLESRFFPQPVKGPDHRVTRKAAPKRPKLIVHPHPNLVAILPSQRRANCKRDIAKYR